MNRWGDCSSAPSPPPHFCSRPPQGGLAAFCHKYRGEEGGKGKGDFFLTSFFFLDTRKYNIMTHGMTSVQHLRINGKINSFASFLPPLPLGTFAPVHRTATAFPPPPRTGCVSPFVTRTEGRRGKRERGYLLFILFFP